MRYPNVFQNHSTVTRYTPQLASPLSFAHVSKAYLPFLAEAYPPIQRGALANHYLSFPLLEQKRGVDAPKANAVLKKEESHGAP